MLVVCRLDGEEERVSGAELVREEDGDSADGKFAVGSPVELGAGVVMVDVRICDTLSWLACVVGWTVVMKRSGEWSLGSGCLWVRWALTYLRS